MENKKQALIIVVGPTASGKTDLAVKLAKALETEVISADSRYFYKGLNIGTAKPTKSEMQGVTHHLIDCTTVDNPWSLGEFRTHALKLIKEINSKGKIPILVGGTGQYIRAITKNWNVPTIEADEGLRITLENWAKLIGKKELWNKLKIVDPEAAKKIDFRNLRRTVRALEVILKTGKRFSGLRNFSDNPLNSLTLGISWPRDLLYKRVDFRIDQMIKQGLVAEVNDLVSQGWDELLRRIGIIGYTEIIDYLEGKLTLEQAVKLIRKNTRVFIRTQSNWFKADDPNIYWLDGKDPALLVKALDLTKNYFANQGIILGMP
ncbi:MAG: tRNA (adenosine(37)-N6)-dimethylallyltransferase MiaA [Anaerolineaceae bacterium]